MRKTLFWISVILSVMLCALYASALELDKTECFEKKEDTSYSFLASDLDIPAYDASYGELIWYNDFESSLSSPVYCKGTSGSASVDSGYGTGELVDSPTGNGKALLIKGKKANDSGYVVKINGYTTTGITVTLVADYYLPSSGTVSTNVWYRFSGYGGKWGLLGSSSAKDCWNTVSYSAATSAQLTSCEFRNNCGVDGIYYLDNVRVYVKYSPGEGKIRLVDGTSVEIVTTGDSYTFGSSSNPYAYHTTWVSDDGVRYNMGETVNASEISGKTFNALITDVPLLDEQKGELIIFHGFEGSSYAHIEYFSDNMFDGLAFERGDGLTFNTFAHVKQSANSSGKALEMTLKDGAAYTISGFQYTPGNRNFVPQKGVYSEYIDIYNRNEGSYLSRDSLYCGDLDEGNIFGLWGHMTDIEFTPYTWVRDVAFTPLSVYDNTNEATADTAKYVIGWGTDTYQKSALNHLRYIQHRFTGAGKTSITVDNYRMYFYPSDGFMVKNGADLALERATDGSYTFKAASELFDGDFAANVCYTDGENKFFAGQTVEISKIAGKTLTLEEVYPENSGSAEIRVGSTAAKTGIRFMASISPSVKAQVSEYGFLLARKDVLESLDAELTFGLSKENIPNGEGILFVKGAAYKLDEDGTVITDKVYGTGDDGSVNFTVVAVGLDITQKKHVTSKLTARPYFIMKDADGNEFTAYGESYSQSLADVAQVLKTEADGGNQVAMDSYTAAGYEGGNLIDDILATAN